MKVVGKFFKDESGLVTVEWVAIAAALVVGAIAIAWAVLSSLEGPAETIGSVIGTVPSELDLSKAPGL